MATINESLREPILEPITIIGGSARAAAWSARRAFFAPRTADLFADLDLCELADARQVSDYPHGLAAVLRESHGGGWMYCGALENEPDLIECWSHLRPLFGNTAESVRQVRDPWQVAACLKQAGVCCLDLAESDVALPRDGTWLRKPRRSAGGQAIVPLRANTPPTEQPGYFQRWMPGASLSSAYVAADGRSRLVGITRQLLTPGTFRYCGSIGPISLPVAVLDQFHRIGTALASAFSLVGLFGIDAIVADGLVWPVEINPRYTASMEVLERALNFSAVAWHVAACRDGRLPDEMLPASEMVESCRRIGGPESRTSSHNSPARTADRTPAVVGKQVVFAETDVVIQDDLRQHLAEVADVPRPGQTIPAESPVLTVLRGGSDSDDVASLLAEAAISARRLLKDPAAVGR